MGLKIFHLGLCVAQEPFNELQLSFIRNSTEYRELNCGEKDVNEKALTIARVFQPDLVFMQIQAPNIIKESTVNQLKKMGAFVVNWTGDVRDSVPKWMYEVNASLNLFTNMRDVKEMRSKGFKADYLEIGYNEHIYCPEGPVTPTKDIVFFGNNYGGKHFPMSQFRIDMVKFLQNKYGSRFGVYGTGWQNGNGNFNHSQPEEAAAYRGAKIAINCSHYEIEDYSSDRLLRILGTGVPICMAKYYPGMYDIYSCGIHLRSWETLGQLSNQIDNHLIQDNSVIVNEGRGLALRNFTFDMMIKGLIKLYHANRN